MKGALGTWKGHWTHERVIRHMREASRIWERHRAHERGIAHMRWALGSWESRSALLSLRRARSSQSFATETRKINEFLNYWWTFCLKAAVVFFIQVVWTTEQQDNRTTEQDNTQSKDQKNIPVSYSLRLLLPPFLTSFLSSSTPPHFYPFTPSPSMV